MAGFVPTRERPPLQELARGAGRPEDYGWRVMATCVLLNRCQRAQAEPAHAWLLRTWPHPQLALEAWTSLRGRIALESLLTPLGFQRRRADRLVALTRAWLAGERDPRRLPGCGPYAVDAWRVFVERDLSVEPEDRVLAAWVSLLRRQDQVSPRAARDTTCCAAVGNTDAQGGLRMSSTTAADAAKQTKRSTAAKKGAATRARQRNAIEREQAAKEIGVNPDAMPAGELDDAQMREELLAATRSAGLGEPDDAGLDAGMAKASEVDGIRTMAPEDREIVLKGIMATVRDEQLAAKTAADDQRKAAEADKKPRPRPRRGSGTGAAPGKDPAEVERELAKARAEDERTRASGGSKSSGRKGASKRPAYAPEITEAVRLAKKARGTTNGAPGAKQHVLTRQVVTKEHLTTEPSVAEIVDAAGVSSLKKLRAVANGQAPRDEVAKLRPLGAEIPDPFCSGRNLASILVAWCDQLQGS